jgi:hypothetical protein
MSVLIYTFTNRNLGLWTDPNPRVAHWDMEGTNATQTLDVSGNSRNASNMPTSATGPMWSIAGTNFGGRIELCFDLDGATNYFDASDNDAFTFTSGGSDTSFTITAWINLDDSASTHQIVSKFDNREYQFFVYAGGSLYGELYSEADPVIYIGRGTGNILSTGVWTHVALSYSGNRAESGIDIYKDGVVVDSVSDSVGSYVSMTNTTASLWIGARWVGGQYQYMDGRVDDVRMYSPALSSNQINTLATKTHPQTNIERRVTDPRITDQSVAGASAGEMFGVTQVPSTNNFANYLNFGVDSYVVVSNREAFTFRQPTNDIPFTIAMCTRDTNPTGCYPIGRMSNVGGGGWWVTFQYQSGANYTIFQLSSLPDASSYIGRNIACTQLSNLWNASVFTYDGKQQESGMKIYWGARRADDTSYTVGGYTGLCVIATNVQLGLNRFTNAFYKGAMANLWIATNAWNQNDVMSWLTNVCTNIGYDFSCGNYLIWSNSVYENTFSSPDYGCDSSFAAENGNADQGTRQTDGTNSWTHLNGAQRVLMRVNASLNPTTSNFACSAWIKITNSVGLAGVCELGGWYGNPYFRTYYDATRKPVMWIRDNGGSETLYLTPTNVMELNKWYNLVATWNGAKVGSLYLDGALLGSATNNNFGAISGLNNLMWGRIGYGAGYWHYGMLDEGRIWKGVDITPYIGQLYSNRAARFGR